MSAEIEQNLAKIPIINFFVALLKRVKLTFSDGLSLYDLLELYVIGIAKGAFSYRAGAIAFSFFMALFPFALFILNLVPYIPIEGFQDDFMEFVAQAVPPNTFDAIKNILDDIMTNSYKGLLSSGFLLSIFLMSNGINAVLGGFEISYHITVTRSMFRQYLVSVALSIMMALLLLVTVAVMVTFEVIIQKITIKQIADTSVYLIQWGRFAFVILMIITLVSTLYKFGTKQKLTVSFFSYGSVLTTILFVLSSYIFGIYVERFARYNELYGSIGTLLVFMIYIWLNCMILLLGFELNATVSKLKKVVK